jgi:hypothetical protein
MSFLRNHLDAQRLAEYEAADMAQRNGLHPLLGQALVPMLVPKHLIPVRKETPEEAAEIDLALERMEDRRLQRVEDRDEREERNGRF